MDPGLRAAQYTSLRAEILQSQQTRVVILGLVFAAVAATSGLAIGPNAAPSQAFVAGLSGFQFLTITVSLYLTIVLTHRIELLAAFIRTHIEIKGMWETSLAELRGAPPDQGVRLWRALKATPPLNTSRALAVIYLVLVFAAFLVYLAAVRGHPGWSLPVPVLGSIVSAYVAIQLCRRKWSNPFAEPER